MPRPGTAHGLTVTRTSAFLETRFGGGGPGAGWVLMVEPDLHLGDDVLVPDIGGWTTARMPRLPDAPWLSVPPDWVCEALSPSTAGIDRVKKTRVYARSGIGWYWILDPSQRTIEVLKLVGDRYSLHSTCMLGERLSLEPFSTETFDPVGWWLDTDEAPPEQR